MQQANENGIAHIVIRELSESDRAILGHVKRVTARTKQQPKDFQLAPGDMLGINVETKEKAECRSHQSKHRSTI
jgi:hypothetical protein